MSAPIPEKVRKTLEAIAARAEAKPVTNEQLERMIEWAKGAEPDGFNRSDLLNVLLEVRLKRTFG